MFSTVTSVCFSSDLTISSPRGDLRFSVIDFLLALNWWKYQGSLSGFPGCRRRPGSPVAGFSILSTSAPGQAKLSVQDGHASRDPFAVEWIDERDDYGEERLTLLGLYGRDVLFAAYTQRGENIRI